MQRKWLFIIIIFIFYLFIDFIAGRIITFYDEQQKNLLHQEDLKEKEVREFSNIYHHGLKPNINTEHSYGLKPYRFITNDLGFKDRINQKIPLETNQYRIVFIGDSFTEGIGVNYDETFVGIIDKELGQKNIDILNAAAVSYSPKIYYRKIKYLLEDVGLKFDELIVYLDISDIENDAVDYYLDSDEHIKSGQDTNGQAGIEKKNTMDYLKENSLLFRFLSYVWTFYRGYSVLNEDIRYRINKDISLWTIDDHYFKEYGEKGLQSCDEYLTKLLKLLRARGIKMTLEVHPWPDQIRYHDLNSIQVTYWQKWAQENHVDFINDFPVFINDQNWRDVLKKNTIFANTHWNPNGHKLISENFIRNYKLPDKALEK